MPREPRTMCDVWEGSRKAMGMHSGRISLTGQSPVFAMAFYVLLWCGHLEKSKGAAKEET